MFAKISTLFKSPVIRALALVIAGLWFLLIPGSVYTVIKWVLVAVLLASAVPALIQGLRARRATGNGGWALSRGIFLTVAALLVAAFLQPMLSMLPALLGIVVVFFGINKITTAKSDQRFVNVSPLPQILYGVVVIIAGAILVFNPFHAVLLLFRVTGAMMLVMAVMEIGTALRRH
ncbi:HdeD family acid-resistance protein [Lacticaseibacillus sp. GG6-2]